jgi:hypothetical protein
MKNLLLDIKKQVEKAKKEGKKILEQGKLIEIENQYQTIIDSGIKSIPPLQIKVKKRGKPKKPKQLNF